MIVVENRATWENFLKSRFVIFKCQKYVKKGYIEMTKKIYLETFKKCPSSLCFPLLVCPSKTVGNLSDNLALFKNVENHFLIDIMTLNWNKRN